MKVPLSYSLKNRASTTDTDARVLNGYVEVRGDPKKGGTLRTVKRPALDSAFDLTAGDGQGLYVANTPDGASDVLGVVIGDILTRAPGAKKKRLSFGTQPTQSKINTAISPSMTVRVLNSLGAVVTTASDAVTLALFSNPTGATLGGTTTQNAASGVATFNNITLDRSGEGFTFQATGSALNSTISDEFTIPTQLAFTTQPSSTTPNTAFTAVVTVQDTAGNTDTAYSGFVTMAIYSASPGGATLGGNLLRQAVSGVATFSDLTVDIETTCTLVATAAADSGQDCYTPALRVSNSFVIADTYTLVAGSETPDFFTYIGFNASVPDVPVIGSISPTTISGQTIIGVFTFFELNPPDTEYVTQLAVSGTQVQGLFTSITNNTNGKVLLAADATFTPGAIRSTWQWPVGNEASNSNMFTAATTYDVAIV